MRGPVPWSTLGFKLEPESEPEPESLEEGDAFVLEDASALDGNVEV